MKIKNHNVNCNPWHLELDSDGELLYVINYNNRSDKNGKIYIYEINTLSAIKNIHIGQTPIKAICDGKNQNIYVTDFDMDCVHIYNLKDNKYNGHIEVNSMPYGIESDDEKGMLFVTSVGQNTVDVVDIHKKTMVQSIPVGREPTGIIRNIHI